MMKCRYPDRDDYNSDEEYKAAVNAYEDYLSNAEDEERERYYEEKYDSN